MNKQLQNFIDLFSEDDAIVYKAILAKKDWLFVPLFLRGNVDSSYDKDNLEHFCMIEALYDDVLSFEKIHLDKKLPLKAGLKAKIENELSAYAKLVFLDSIPNDDSPFFAEYDFTKINEETYHALLANFYPCLSARILSIDSSLLESSLVERLKCVMLGSAGEHVLIVDRTILLNDSLYAPILRVVHVRQNANPVLKEELHILCKEKGIIYKEVVYDRN